MMGIPPELQEKFVQFEQMRRQLSMVSSQRMQLEGEFAEVEETLKAVDTLGNDAVIYKNAGNLLIKIDDLKGLKDELDEKKETVELRVKTLRTQEDRLKEKFDSLQEELSTAINTMQGANIKAK